ncbi:MAG: hypothetical protein JEY71_18105, partial [Sphaerochaeta sp.]|nr:hypothetical protein [Sphaerochaeta sp.]
AAKIASKEVEPGSACQAIARDLDIVYEFCSIPIEIGHPALRHVVK